MDILNAAQERIRAVYDPALLESAGQRLVSLLTEHFEAVESSQGKVLNWRDPDENMERAAASLLQFAPYEALSVTDIQKVTDQFADLVRLALQNTQNIHDPRYLGHQVPAPVPLAGLFDAMGAVTNQVMAVYEMGPWSTVVEYALVNELGKRIGWKEGTFAGLITHGGSLANLTALLTARNVSLGSVWEKGVSQTEVPPVIVVHADAHYSVTRAAGILGLGTENVIRAPLDERRRMDPQALDLLLTRLQGQGHPIVAVAAAACATPIGAFDPLNAVADVCERHEVWMHVDAAHGGSACLSDQHRDLLKGLDRADSVVWDAHKMLFVPALCAFVFYRNAEHRFEAFRQDAPYLFDPSAPGIADYDSGLKTIECTKRAAAFGLWGTWSLFGPQLFADLVDVTFALGQVFYKKLIDAPDFQPLHEPQCNIVVFRYVPDSMKHASMETLGAFQLALRRKLMESGEFYLVPSKVEGVGALRVTLINPLTTADHLDAFMDALRRMRPAVDMSENTL